MRRRQAGAFPRRSRTCSRSRRSGSRNAIIRARPLPGLAQRQLEAQGIGGGGGGDGHQPQIRRLRGWRPRLRQAQRLEAVAIDAFFARDRMDESAQPLPQLRIVGTLRPARGGTGLGNGRGAGPRGEGQRRGEENGAGHRYGSEAGATLRRATDTTGAIGDGSERGAPWPSCCVATSVARRAAARWVTAAITRARRASRPALRRSAYKLSPPSGPPASSVPFTNAEISSCSALSAGSPCWQVSGERK